MAISWGFGLPPNSISSVVAPRGTQNPTKSEFPESSPWSLMLKLGGKERFGKEYMYEWSVDKCGCQGSGYKGWISGYSGMSVLVMTNSVIEIAIKKRFLSSVFLKKVDSSF